MSATRRLLAKRDVSILTCGSGPGLAADGPAKASSDISSSISVVSVPFEVTGDGPTMSLGLMRLRFVDGILEFECGRRD